MTSELFAKNRVILSHFDSYSTALVFARFGKTLLGPDALPEGATNTATPDAVEAVHDGDAVLEASIARYGLNSAEVFRDGQFDAWLQAGADRIRIHLLRFKTFLAPAELLAAHGGVFKPISELRGSAAVELGLIRGVFNLIMGGDQKRG